jgi:hypothetical protein
MRDLLKPSNTRLSNEMSDDESVSDGSDENADEEAPAASLLRKSRTISTSTVTEQWPSTTTCTHAPTANSCGPKDPLGPAESDIIDRGIITEAMAEEMMSIYRDSGQLMS